MKQSKLFKLPTISSIFLLFIVINTLFSSSLAVKRGDFKTCDQSGFCKRNRALADRAISTGLEWKTPYSINSIPTFSNGIFKALIGNELFPNIGFSLEARFQQDGTARILMDEVNGLRQRYNEAGNWAVQKEPILETSEGGFTINLQPHESSIKYAGGLQELKIQHKPILLTFLRDGQPHIVLNERGLLNMEHFRVKKDSEPLVIQEAENAIPLTNEYPNFLPENEEGMWEETFGGKTDSKPKGPESLSLDITFPGYGHVYGIPQHASSLSLKQTRGGDGAYTDPYRLYNLDVFEYDADSEMAIYGSIPFMKAHRAGSTVAVFLVSGSEAWIDITKAPTSQSLISSFTSPTSNSIDKGPSPITTTTHWMTESGILDLFVFLGPTPASVFQSYTALTGLSPLPQLFAIAYHQCRWNYLSQEDVLDVQGKFELSDIPFDVIWLDIEYAEEHKYFVWDRRYFPDPEMMQDRLAEKGRKLVAIVDPHIKRDPGLYIYTEAQQLDILTKMPDGTTDFEGWCWTGSSAWTDWFNPKSWDWWIGAFAFEKFKGSTKNLFVWNDMNEPSIFNGPEITMQKDAIHYGGWEHRDVHNIFGMIYQNLTAQGLVQREDPPKRPFVLTRAFYAGSQRFGAMWTGDNLGTWEHLKGTVSMLLTNGIAGMTFSGADVGGFFGNPSAEMMVRWYQLGAFQPFFRAHGHIDTKRREPYLFEQPIQSYIRDAIRLRYTILPAFYTAFYEASLDGTPILRPQYIVFPNDEGGFAIDDQFYLGSSGLIFKPVIGEGQEVSEIYIADDQPYYHYFTHDIYFGASNGGSIIKVPAPLSSIPALHQGGSILPQRDLVRRSATLTWKDPITLIVALDITGTKATGSLYLDDGESYSNEKGEFVLRGFVLSATGEGSNLALKSRSLQSKTEVQGSSVNVYDPEENAWARKISDVVVRKITVLGLASKPSCIKKVGSDVGLEFEWTSGVASTSNRQSGGAGKKASILTITDADLRIVRDWDLVLEFGSSSTCSFTPSIDHDAPFRSPECTDGRFQCKNVGHFSSCILRSRVNDGVCDSECCDGSDEMDGKVHCPNTCEEVGREYRKKNEEDGRKNRVGAAVRKEYISFGIKEKKRLEEEVEKARKEIVGLEQREKAAQSALSTMEASEAGDIEMKTSSLLYQQIVEMQAAIKSLRLNRAALDTQVVELSGILSDLSRDFNPNYQDMAVLGASRAFKDWQTRNGEGDEDAVIAEPVSSIPITPSEPDISDVDLQALENEDPLSLIDSLSSRVGSFKHGSSTEALFKIEQYLPDAWKPLFQQYKEQLISILVKTGIVNAPATSETAAVDRPELAKARAAHSALVTEVNDAKNILKKSEESLVKDWGRDWEWKKLDGTCVEKDLGDVCFFGEAVQKANSGGATTSLGKFDSWSTTAVAKSDDYYKKQVYNEGQRCWNGPARSAKLDIICAPTNALLSVIEPEKCEYLFTVSSPAVCFPQEGGHQKDEL